MNDVITKSQLRTHRHAERRPTSPPQTVGIRREQEERQWVRVKSNWCFANGFSYESVTRRKLSNWILNFHDSWQKKLGTQLAKKLRFSPQDIKENMTGHLTFNDIFVLTYTFLSLKDYKIVCPKEIKYSQKKFQRWGHGKSILMFEALMLTITSRKEYRVSNESCYSEGVLTSCSSYFWISALLSSTGFLNGWVHRQVYYGASI